MRHGAVRKLSYQRIFAKIKTGVIHTESLKRYLCSHRIRNVKHIEYPKFETEDSKRINTEEAKKQLDLDTDRKVLLVLGGIRWDKGLDILLDALSGVRQDFFLYIAGMPEDFDESFIKNKSAAYADRVRMQLCRLTDEEMNLAAAASDIVVLPYRRIFEGASGPLAEGVWQSKMIVGPGHGSLGKLIRQNELGYTFETEDREDLGRVIKKAITVNWIPGSQYKKYQREICEQSFRERYKRLYESFD